MTMYWVRGSTWAIRYLARLNASLKLNTSMLMRWKGCSSIAGSGRREMTFWALERAQMAHSMVEGPLTRAPVHATSMWLRASGPG